MELNNTTQYAIRILNYINKNDEGTLCSARKIAEDLDINYKFLTTIMTKLVKAELLLSIRGKEGGFKLLKQANDIYIIDLLKLFDTSLSQESCILGIDKCDDNKKCFMHDKWLKPKQKMYEMFKSTSLEDLKGRGEKF